MLNYFSRRRHNPARAVFRSGLALLAPVLVSAPLLANPGTTEPPRWFEIELVIFERAPETAQSSERWPADLGSAELAQMPDHIANLAALRAYAGQEIQPKPDTADKPVAGTEASQDSGEVAEPASERLPKRPDNLLLAEPQLGELVQKLKNHSGYRILLHDSWQQPVLPPGVAQPVHLYGGKDLSKKFHLHGQPRVRPEEMPPSRWNMQQNPPVWGVEGQLRLWLDHYLYLDTRLMLRRAELLTALQRNQLQGGAALPEAIAGPASDSQTTEQPADSTAGSDELTGELSDEPGTDTPADSLLSDAAPDEQQAAADNLDNRPEPWLVGYQLHQQRRIRSGEIHYLDHPLMGVVLQIRRMEQPVTEQPADSTH